MSKADHLYILVADAMLILNGMKLLFEILNLRITGWVKTGFCT